MHALDLATRKFWRATGRPVDLHGADSRWRMEAWTSWSPAFWPGGEIVSRLFGKRVQQLALPMRPLDVAQGIDSTVTVIADAEGNQRAAAWLRTLRATGDYVLSGCYSVRSLPGSDRPSVHVAFPLEAGNVQVFLRPYAEDGALVLKSPRAPFGGDGAYVVVEDRGRAFAARAPVHETFRVYVDPVGIVRTDHLLQLWNTTAVRLHYKLERMDGRRWSRSARRRCRCDARGVRRRQSLGLRGRLLHPETSAELRPG